MSLNFVISAFEKIETVKGFISGFNTYNFSSPENLEAKMKWLKNFERVQQIQQQILWQPISELDPRAFIPEVSMPSGIHCVKFKHFV